MQIKTDSKLTAKYESRSCSDDRVLWRQHRQKFGRIIEVINEIFKYKRDLHIKNLLTK